MTSNHERNTGPMIASKRCGAKTRAGKPCQAPAVSGKERCRMHGGASGSGAQAGNSNAFKSGRFTQENLEYARQDAATFRFLRDHLKSLGVKQKKKSKIKFE